MSGFGRSRGQLDGQQIAIGQPVGGGVITYGAAGHQFVAAAAGMQSPQVWHTTGTNEIVVFGL